MRTKIYTLLFSLLMGILPTFAQVQIPYYESFLGSSGEFSVSDVHRDSVLTYVWKNSNLYGMVASGYLAGNHNAESWLISPLISLPDTNNINLSFEQALKYEDHGVYDHIAVKISVNNGTSWTNLALPNNAIGNDWTFRQADVLLDEYAGNNVRIAFVYTSTQTCAPTWEIKNFAVKISPLEGQCGETLYWNLDYNTGHLSITGSGNMWDSIPNLHWHEHKAHIATIDFPDGITSIGYFAFMSCENLQTTILPEGIASIGPGAFYDCVSLSSINLPKSVKKLGKAAFVGCESLTEPLHNLHIFAFMPRTYEGVYVIPDSIVAVASYSFQQCDLLTEIVIPAATQRIGVSAFYDCYALEKVTCYALNPPTCEKNAFNCSTYEEPYVKMTESALYVPQECVGVYQTADTWK